MGEEIVKSRVRCATLALGTLQAAVEQFRRDRERREPACLRSKSNRSRSNHRSLKRRVCATRRLSTNGVAMAQAPKVTEITLCAAWHSGAATTLQTVSGETIEIVHRGAWTHGLGPDFRDALILFAGRELRAGSIEVHHRTRGWTDHHHHLDPAYNSVILHLVAHHDGSQTQRQDGAIVPVAELGPLRDLSGSELAAMGLGSRRRHLLRRRRRLCQTTRPQGAALSPR